MRTRAALLVALAALLATTGRARDGRRPRANRRRLRSRRGEFPEGIAADPTGNLYVSLALRDEIVKIAPDGNQTVVATLAPGTRPAGLAVAADGVVYAAATALDLPTGGTDPPPR